MQIMDTQTVAKYLGVSIQTVRNYMEQGMPYCQPVKRGKIFFDLKKVENWMNGHKDSYAKFLRKSM